MNITIRNIYAADGVVSQPFDSKLPTGFSPSRPYATHEYTTTTTTTAPEPAFLARRIPMLFRGMVCFTFMIQKLSWPVKQVQVISRK